MKKLAACILLVACNSSATDDYIKNRKKDDKTDMPAGETDKSNLPPPPVKKKALTEAELGNCHLTASGAVTADQTTPGGRAATNISYWYSPDEQKTMMGVDGFVVNCNGTDIRFSMVPGGGKQDGMPFKAKTYTFDSGKGDATLMIGFGKQQMTNPSGTINITAFDSHHIAGTIDLSGKLGTADEKLSGQFDLVCPGLSACQ
ncbi:MAG TPA: hypothetical protein VGL61_02985 [Kofleriaceae bacterium]|jgi:hypothetical protein